MSIPTEEPIRLLKDPASAASLKADMGIAAGAAADGIDFSAGVTTLKAALAAETAVVATTTAAGTSVAIKAGVVALLASGAIALWAGTRPADETPVPAVQPPVISTVQPEVEPPQPKFELPPPPPQLPAVVVEVEPEPSPVVTPRAKPRPEAKPEETAPPAAPGPDFVREAKLVAKARRSLASSPRQALQLTEEAANEFPRGQLVEEREAIAIRALAKLGRTAAARSRAERFLAKHGNGPHADAVRRATDL